MYYTVFFRRYLLSFYSFFYDQLMDLLRDRNPIVFTIKLIIICNSFSLQALRTFYTIENKDIFRFSIFLEVLRISCNCSNYYRGKQFFSPFIVKARMTKKKRNKDRLRWRQNKKESDTARDREKRKKLEETEMGTKLERGRHGESEM